MLSGMHFTQVGRSAHRSCMASPVARHAHASKSIPMRSSDGAVPLAAQILAVLVFFCCFQVLRMLRGSPGSRALPPIACLTATVLSFGTVTAAVGLPRILSGPLFRSIPIARMDSRSLSVTLSLSRNLVSAKQQEALGSVDSDRYLSHACRYASPFILRTRVCDARRLGLLCGT